MLKTKAISPEVKELFETVNKQADKYKSAYAEIERHLQWATSEKNNLNELKESVPKRLEETISKLSAMVEEYIEEVTDKSQRAIKIGDELETIDRYKADMQKLRVGLQNNMVDLKKALADFNTKSEQELEKVLINLKEKISTELSKETEKIEVRLAVRAKKLAEQVNAFEQRNRRVIERVRLDSKQIVEEATNNAKEIRIISDDLNEYKELLTPKVKEQHDFIKKLKKKYDTDFLKMEEKIDRVMKMGVAGSLGGGGGYIQPAADPHAPEVGIDQDAMEDPDGIFAPYDPSKRMKKDTPLSLDAAPKRQTPDQRIDELTTIIEEEKKKTNMALWLAGLSIAGSIMVLLIAVVS